MTEPLPATPDAKVRTPSNLRLRMIASAAMIAIACAALWAFATRTALRAWVGILIPTALFWIGTRLLQGVA